MIRHTTPTGSTQYDFEFYQAERQADETVDLSSLDHGFFGDEVRKLKNLQTQTLRDRFHSRDSQGTEAEWFVYQQLESAIADMDWNVQSMQPLDPQQLLTQIQELAETLIKLRTGCLPTDHVEQLMAAGEQWHDGDYDGYDDDEEYYELEEQLCAPKSNK